MRRTKERKWEGGVRKNGERENKSGERKKREVRREK